MGVNILELISDKTLASLSKRGLVHNHSYENEFNLHVNEISFSYERMSTKTRFEKEAKGNSEMAYLSKSKRGMKLSCVSRGSCTERFTISARKS